MNCVLILKNVSSNGKNLVCSKILILFIFNYKLTFKYKNSNTVLKYHYYTHKHQNKRRQLVKIVSFGLTANMKSIVNLDSEVCEKGPIMNLQLQLYIKQQFCVSGIQALNWDL